MTFQQIYAEITQRTGQGYGAYTDRAKAAFWKALGAIVRESHPKPEEARKMMTRHEDTAYLAEEFPYDLSTSTAITSYHVFDMDVMVSAGSPALVHFVRLSELAMPQANLLDPLRESGLKQVFYTLKYPHIEVMFSRQDGALATGWCRISILWYGVPRELVEGSSLDSTDANEYMIQSLMDAAVEKAVALMAQET